MVAVPLFLAAAVAVPADEPSNDSAPIRPFEARAVVDPDAAIVAQMRAQWAKPERQKWRIVYHPIKGLSDRSSWHIEGTHWWVRLNPQVYKLEDLDKNAVYEIDAVALDQNYGVIDFYVHRPPQRAPK